MTVMMQEQTDSQSIAESASPSTRWSFAVALTACFAVISAITLARHEMWRDELQAWLIARDSSSILDMLHALKLEGHPPLWYLLLYGLTRLTHDPRSMQVLNWFIATATVFLIARFAPFTRLQRALLAFGYYPLFEYGALSRDYGVALLAVVIACIGYRRFERTGKALLLTIGLILMAMLTVYTLLLAGCVVFMIGCRCIWDSELRPLWLKNRIQWLAAAAVVLITCAVSALQMRPPAGSGFAVGWHTELSGVLLAKVLGTVWKAYLPIPRPTYEFWNSNILQNKLSPLQPFMGIALLAGAIGIFRRDWRALLLFVTGTAWILAFEYLKYLGYTRHNGWLFVALVMSLWFLYDRQTSATNEQAAPPHWARPALTALLAVNCAVGLFAVGMDWRFPFASGRELATYLQTSKLENEQIVGHWDYAASPLSAWLNKPIYFADSHNMGTYIHWDNSRTLVTDQQAADVAIQLANQSHKEVLLVLTPDPDTSTVPVIESAQTQLVHVFDAALVPSERYWLYRVSPDRLIGRQTDLQR